jgi:hypothetical protein
LMRELVQTDSHSMKSLRFLAQARVGRAALGV